MFNLSSLLHRLTTNLPMRIIDLDSDAYLERYHVATLFGRRIWLHHFVRNDSDRHVHDHPWNALSVILTGSYIEVVQTPANNFDVAEHTAPGLNWIPSGKRHRIISVDPGTWSLMLVGRRQSRGWYFYDTDGKQERRGPSPRNPDWQLTAGTREEEYKRLNVQKLRREFLKGRPMPDLSVGYFEEVENLKSELTELTTKKILELQRLKTADVFHVDAPSEQQSLIDDINRHRRNIYGEDTPPILLNENGTVTIPDEQAVESIVFSRPLQGLSHGGAELSELEQIKRAGNPFRAYGSPSRPNSMSEFEWLTRCQRELAAQTGNYVGDWWPVAFSALHRWFHRYPTNPEAAARSFLGH